jgi:DNA-binding CsgD family transcriptional regulator
VAVECAQRRCHAHGLLAVDRQNGDVVAARDRDGTLAFVGRDAELRRVAERAERARQGRASLVWVEGDGGLGKTALVGAIERHLLDDFVVRRAEADELAGDRVLDVVHQLASVSGSDGFAIGLDLLEVVGRWQATGPVALIIEDLHWADEMSRQALLTLVRRLGDDRVLVIVTSRSVGNNDGWERLSLDPDRALHLRLRPFDVEEIAALASLHGVELARAAAERLATHTDGHPLHARTLLAELTPEQLRAPGGHLPAPRSLASAVLAKMAEFPADSQALAAAIAVLHPRVPLEAVGGVAQVADPTVPLESLLRSGLVTWFPTEIGTPVTFTHPLHRSAVYHDLSPSTRQALHLRAASVLHGESALRHRVAAADPDDDTLVDDLDAAAQNAVTHADRSAAARYWSWAGDLAASRTSADAYRFAAVRTLLANGQVRPAAALRDGLRDEPANATHSAITGLVALHEGDANVAESQLSQAAISDDPEIGTAALVGLADLYRGLARGDALQAVAHRLFERTPLQPEDEQAAWIALATGIALTSGAPLGVDALTPRLPHDRATVASTDARLLTVRGSLNWFGGRTVAAIADLRQAINLGKRARSPIDPPRAHHHLAQALFWSGDWSDALLHARVAQSLVADDHELLLRAPVYATLAYLLASRGERKASEDALTLAAQYADEQGTVEALVRVRLARATCARARGDDAQVVELLGSFPDHEMPMLTSLSWWPPLAGSLIAVGQLERAADHLERAENAARERGLDLAARLEVRRAQLAGALGDADACESGTRDALASMDEDTPQLDRAQAHEQLGHVLLARGRRREGTDELRRALELLASMGAASYCERVERALADSGLHPGGNDPAGSRAPLRLTDRERDVAVLVVRGLTNKEAAAELYVSAKAVEYHLSNIYGKLGVRSRRELATAFDAT